ncbi:DNA starvation/stationary phase protection protein [Candidatus Gracilibacteria bacterium]|nr:DNA starvation/stationary phase protection protein [Candidatus Gracilibacteria bacterium]MCF7819292.1 DNA starvation/stationary phase protection protein [Candidatus Gracilibacteria bacterium]
MKTGLDSDIRKALAAELSKILASNYLLLIKTQNFHWNVTGSHFRDLHLMFEEQYNDLFGANDEIAERIRALGFAAPGTIKEFASLSFLKDAQEIPKAEEMVAELLKDHETMIQSIRKLIKKAGDAQDEATNDLLSPRIDAHEKTAWMLRSFLG